MAPPLPESILLMNQIEAFERAVARLVSLARQLFYELTLCTQLCPGCEGALVMVREGRCRCTACGKAMDPTETFQTCPACNGPVRLRVRRYACRRCGADVPSRFLFDGKVFDPEYFRRKMAESRERRLRLKRERSEQAPIQHERAPAVEPAIVDFQRDPTLVDLLDQLVGRASPDPYLAARAEKQFDLRVYQRHVLQHLREMTPGDETTLRSVPQLNDEDSRLERVRLFIALIFLRHAGAVTLRQADDGQIWVSQHETQRQRHPVPADPARDAGLA